MHLTGCCIRVLSPRLRIDEQPDGSAGYEANDLNAGFTERPASVAAFSCSDGLGSLSGTQGLLVFRLRARISAAANRIQPISTLKARGGKLLAPAFSRRKGSSWWSA